MKSEPKLTVGALAGEWEGTYIKFSYSDDQPDSGLTVRWIVANKGELAPLGYVKWFARWRKYAFLPFSGCIFEETCMREIAMFIEDRTKDHKAKK